MKLAHVLFTDIVGYSKLSIDQQTLLLGQLQEIVGATSEFTRAKSEERLISLPTGDGIALTFFDDPEAPIRCALEIDAALKSYPELKLRMGVHSGPINPVVDINGKANVAGAGINTAQRVMDCGNAGHILVSERVADDLKQFSKWQPYLHDLGEMTVKHGVRLHVYNLYTGEAGNPATPGKATSAWPAGAVRRVVLIAVAALILALPIGWAVWRSKEPASGPDNVNSIERLPTGIESSLSYWLTVQKMSRGQPVQKPFASSGQDIFEDGWQVWLNVSAQHSGYFYLFSEVLGGVGVQPQYRVLYPFNPGSTNLIAPKQQVTIPENGPGYFLDDKHGTEKLWLIWSARPVTILEAVKEFGNPVDRGLIPDRARNDGVRDFIASQGIPPKPEKDPTSERMTVSAKGETVIALLELKHH